MRVFLSALSLVGMGGFGYWMYTLIAPGEERRREMLKVRLSPHLWPCRCGLALGS